MRKAVFLDRDGVLNRSITQKGKPSPPASLAELEILPGVREGLAELRKAGFLLIGATNQPDVARGRQQREVVEIINQNLVRELALDDMLVCYHDDQNDCDCRKPKPGLLFQAAKKYQINLADSFMVGDRWRDVEAGRQAGCRTIFIDAGYQERQPDPPAHFTSRDLKTAAAWILMQMNLTRKSHEIS
jgi:D-glycero-D-manno-heptose 1,7-bisphosphate phosphatase